MRTFHKKTGPRKHFKRILAVNLIMKESMTTTVPRAKEMRPIVERLVTIGKKANLAAYRTLLSKLPEQAAGKMFYEIAPRYKERQGGYLRIIKNSKARKRDGAETAIIQFV